MDAVHGDGEWGGIAGDWTAGFPLLCGEWRAERSNSDYIGIDSFGYDDCPGPIQTSPSATATPTPCRHQRYSAGWNGRHCIRTRYHFHSSGRYRAVGVGFCPHSLTSGIPGQPEGMFDSDIHMFPLLFGYLPTPGHLPTIARLLPHDDSRLTSEFNAQLLASQLHLRQAQFDTAQALNLSTRMRVQAGDNAGIGGFIVTGTAPKQVLLRGIGPSLANFGVPDPLADPVWNCTDQQALLRSLTTTGKTPSRRRSRLPALHPLMTWNQPFWRRLVREVYGDIERQ